MPIIIGIDVAATALLMASFYTSELNAFLLWYIVSGCGIGYHLFMNYINNKINNYMEKRILAWLIDYGLILLITAVLENILCNLFPVIGAGLLILALCIFLCKDGFGRQSLGRRIMGIQIVYATSSIKPIRALCRNLFFAILPIELILVLLNKKRIGDIVCKTDVIANNSSQIRCHYIWQNIFLIVLISTPPLIVYYLPNSCNSLLNLMYHL